MLLFSFDVAGEPNFNTASFSFRRLPLGSLFPSCSLRSYQAGEPMPTDAAFSCMQERSFIEQLASCQYLIKQGFVPNMRVPAHFYVNDRLKQLVFEELQMYCQRGDVGGFLPAVKQLCNVAGLPGIVTVWLIVPC